MKKNQLLFFVLTFVLLLTEQGFSQTKFVKGTWQQIKENASKENKLIFVDLYFKGCAPCAQMDEEVFPDKEVSEYLNKNFISFKSDIFKEELGKKLSQKYAVTGFPTFIFLNAKGHVLDIVSGYHSKSDFLQALYLAKSNSNKKIYKKYTTKLAGKYLDFYANAFLKNKRNIPFKTIHNYLKEQPKLDSEIPFVVMMGFRAGGVYGDYVLDHIQKLVKNYSRFQIRNYLITEISRRAKSLGKIKDRAKFDQLLIKAGPAFTSTEKTKFYKIFNEIFNKK